MEPATKDDHTFVIFMDGSFGCVCSHFGFIVDISVAADRCFIDCNLKVVKTAMKYKSPVSEHTSAQMTEEMATKCNLLDRMIEEFNAARNALDSISATKHTLRR